MLRVVGESSLVWANLRASQQTKRLRNRFSLAKVNPIARESRVNRPDPATIYDVARLAGVSPSTVSHVVNSTRKVSLAARRRVEDAIDALSYRPNDTARMLRGGHAKLIGLVLPDISNAYFADLARALEMLAYEQGARLLP